MKKRTNKILIIASLVVIVGIVITDIMEVRKAKKIISAEYPDPDRNWHERQNIWDEPWRSIKIETRSGDTVEVKTMEGR